MPVHLSICIQPDEKRTMPYQGKETLEEEEMEHGVKLDKPLKAHKGKETPEEEAAEEREIAARLKKEGAPRGKHKPWSIQEKKSVL
jgi:hypothetical protein